MEFTLENLVSINRNYPIRSRIKSSYKYVRIYEYKGNLYYKAQITAHSSLGRNWTSLFLDEREAALAVDKTLIINKLQPVNILKQLTIMNKELDDCYEQYYL